MNESPTRVSTAILPSVTSVLIGLAGISLNLASAYIAPSDGVLGVLVLVSMAMIGTGYLPALKKWRGRQWTTWLMNVAMLGFVVYVFCIVGSTDS